MVKLIIIINSIIIANFLFLSISFSHDGHECKFTRESNFENVVNEVLNTGHACVNLSVSNHNIENKKFRLLNENSILCEDKIKYDYVMKYNNKRELHISWGELIRDKNDNNVLIIEKCELLH